MKAIFIPLAGTFGGLEIHLRLTMQWTYYSLKFGWWTFTGFNQSNRGLLVIILFGTTLLFPAWAYANDTHSHGVAGKAAASARALSAYYWDMEAEIDKAGVVQGDWFSKDIPPVRLMFDAKGMAYSENTCNLISWSFSTTDSMGISFKPKFMTAAGCGAELSNRQAKVGTELPKIHRYALETSESSKPERLTLFLADGGRWIFKAIPTPETRFGGPGKQIELEIAMELVACESGSSKQCLTGRRVRWDRNISKICLGDWKVLKDGVEGYLPTPGRHEIIWVREYPLSKGSKEPPLFAYVFVGVHVSVIPSLKKLPDCSDPLS